MRRPEDSEVMESSSRNKLLAAADPSNSPRAAATFEDTGDEISSPPPAPASSDAAAASAQQAGAPPPTRPAPDGESGGAPGLTYDQALTQYVGEFGRGQALNFVLASSVWIPNAMIILLLVFSVGSPVKERHWECADPGDAACAAVLGSADPAVGFCGLGRDQWRWTRPRDTLIAQFDLVCADAWKSQTANSFFFVGYLIGSGVFGQLSDAYGRKKCTFGAAIISAVLAAAGTGCSSYWPWLAVRLLSGIGAAGTALGAYVMATEPIGESWRGAAGIASQVFFIVGEFALVLVALLFKTWRGQAAAVAVVNAAVCLLWPVLPESGRWLLVQGRRDEALKVLEYFVRLNGTQMPERPLAEISAGQRDEGAGAKGGGQRLTLLTALRDWHIARRFYVLAYSWMVICMTYYGISFALSSLGGSLMVSFMVSSIAELPSYIATGILVDRAGRHNTMAGCMILGGAACVACGFVPSGGARVALASVAKFGIAGAFAIASIYTSELFPTLIRSAMLGATNQAARVGGIAAPFVALAGTATNSCLVPFLTFGTAALLGGVLVFTLPETLGVPLPDTMDDMGNIASIFTHKTLKKKGLKAAAASMFKTRVRLGSGGGGAGRSGRAAPAGGGAAGRKGGKLRQQSIWEEDEDGAAQQAAAEKEAAERHILAHRPPLDATCQGNCAGAGGGGGKQGPGSSSAGTAAGTSGSIAGTSGGSCAGGGASNSDGKQ